MENHNPLKQYFRKPGIWVKLPSQGRFYKDKPEGLNDMGEIPVYPMTAKDELLLKNADALLNGNAVYEIIRSCAPGIKTPEETPAVDLDAILLAVRRCTYGDRMDVATQHDCKENAINNVSIDLNMFIAGIKVVDNDATVTFDTGIVAQIKPVTVKQLLHLNWVQYEQIRNIQLAESSTTDEKQRVDLLQTSFAELTKESINVISDCVEFVTLPDGATVLDSTNIKEWIGDLARPEYKKLENAVMGMASKGVDKTFKVHCDHCNQEYDATLDLNPTTFFE